MNTNIVEARRSFADAMHPSKRGYHVPYREGESNHCPGCGRLSWIIGGATAQCGFCETALELPRTATRGVGLIRTRKGNGPWVG